MTPSHHPRSCRSCDGCGWQLGPPLYGIVHGVRLTYPTLMPCGHEWRDDDPHYDADGLERLTPIPFAEYLRRLAIRYRRGDRLAELEIAGWKRARGGDLFGDGS